MLEFNYLKSFANDDAAAVSNLFKLVYGNNYVYPEVYEPETFCRNHEMGVWESVLAMSSDEQVMGHGLLWTHPTCPEIPEMGLFIVHPAARNSGLGFKISQELIAIAKRKGFAGIGSKQVCNHPFSQRLGHSLGFLNLSFWPDYVSSPFIAGETRESVLCAYLPLKTEPKKALFLPRELVSIAKSLTNGLDKIKSIEYPIKSSVFSQSELKIMKSESEISELYLHRWGIDGPQKLANINPDKLTFVLVNAELPENTLACERLLSSGFAFMGLVPDRFHSWTWVFAKNFSFDATHILDEKIKNLIEFAHDQLSMHALFEPIYKELQLVIH